MQSTGSGSAAVEAPQQTKGIGVDDLAPLMPMLSIEFGLRAWKIEANNTLVACIEILSPRISGSQDPIGGSGFKVGFALRRPETA